MRCVAKSLRPALTGSALRPGGRPRNTAEGCGGISLYGSRSAGWPQPGGWTWREGLLSKRFFVHFSGFECVLRLCSHHRILIPDIFITSEETVYLLIVTPTPLSPPAPGRHSSASCFCGLASSGHFTYMESHCGLGCLASLTERRVLEVCPRRSVGVSLLFTAE